jgi:hypothetical protein
MKSMMVENEIKLKLDVGKKWILAALITGLSLRVIYAIVIFATGGKYSFFGPDSYGYDALADELLNHGRFVDSDGYPEVLRVPAFPFLLAVLKFVFGKFYLAALIALQIFFDLFSSFVLYKIILRMTGNNKAAFIILAAQMLNIANIHFSVMNGTDSLGISLFIFSLYFFMRFFLDDITQGGKAQRFHGVKNIVLAFFFLALTIFFRPSFLYLGPLIFIGAAVCLLVLKRRNKLLLLTFAFLVFLLPVLAWTCRNYLETDRFVFTTGSDVLLYSQWPAPSYAKEKNISYYEAFDELSKNEGIPEGLKGLALNDALAKRGKDIIKKNPAPFAVAYAERIPLFFIYPATNDFFNGADMTSETIQSVKTLLKGGGFSFSAKSAFALCFVAVEVAILLALFLLSFFGALRRRKGDLQYFWFKLFLILSAAYLIICHASPQAFGNLPRYRLSVFPILLIFAGIGLSRIFEKSRASKSPSLK